MTRDGLANIIDLANSPTEIAAFSSVIGIPAFKVISKSRCITKDQDELISIRTSTGNHLIASLGQEFLLSSGSSDDPDSIWDTSEIVPAGVLDVGQKLYVLDSSGAIIEDPIVDIEPVEGDHRMCLIEHEDDCFPVLFAGGFGILSG